MSEGPRSAFLIRRWLRVTPLLLGAACGGREPLGERGALCFRDDECEAGLICVAPSEGDSKRVCSNDPTPLISNVQEPPVMEMPTGGSAGAGATGGASGAAAAGGGAGGTPASGGGGTSAGNGAAGSGAAGSGGTANPGGTGGGGGSGGTAGNGGSGGSDAAGGAESEGGAPM